MAFPIPTTLNEEQVKEFQMLHKKHFNIDISRERALEEGVRLMQFVALVIKHGNSFKE